MDIDPSEIHSVKTIGQLNDNEVALVTLKGGFNIAVGKKDRKSNKNEVLAGGSHPGIVLHQVNKSYSGFVESISKSETEYYKLEDFSQMVNKNESGYQLLTIEESDKIGFYVLKNDEELGGYLITKNDNEFNKMEFLGLSIEKNEREQIASALAKLMILKEKELYGRPTK